MASQKVLVDLEFQSSVLNGELSLVGGSNYVSSSSTGIAIGGASASRSTVSFGDISYTSESGDVDALQGLSVVTAPIVEAEVADTGVAAMPVFASFKIRPTSRRYFFGRCRRLH
jgi:hypothetical protein